jgi:predicted MPP superfamily phosphohydrolase
LSRARRFRLIAAMGPPPARARRRRLFVIFPLLLLYGWAGHVEPDWLEVTRHVVPLKVPRALKVAHLSDLHTVGLWRRERRLVAALDAEKPDLIVITGDTLCQGGNYDQCRPMLERLKAPLGVYMVPGNWEIANPIRDLPGFFKSCGVRFLRNESVEVTPGLWVVGLDDFALGVPDLKRACAAIPDGATKIVLCHSPGFFDQGHGEYPLAFSGHTHGGQFRLPFLPPLHLPAGCGRFVEGWYDHEGARMYVSRGIGMSGPRFRLLCRPELAIHELVPSTD